MMMLDDDQEVKQPSEQIQPEKVKNDGSSSSSDDDSENGDELAVDKFEFAADDKTLEIPYPQKYVIVLPKHLQKLLQLDEEERQNIANNGGGSKPIRIFKAPHPRHGEQVLFLAASYLSGNTSSGFELGEDHQVAVDDVQEDSSSSPNTKRVRLLRIYELQSRKPLHSTWFIGDNVEPQSPLLIASPIHPAFFALRLVVSDAIASVGGKDAFENILTEFVPSGEENSSSASNNNNNNRFRFRASDDWTMMANKLLFPSSSVNSSSSSMTNTMTTTTTIPYPNLWDDYLKAGFECVCEQEEKEGTGKFYRFSPQKTTEFLRTRLNRLTRSRSFDHLVFGASSSSSSSSENNNQQGNSSSSNNVLEDRAAGLILDYVTKELSHLHAKNWIFGSAAKVAAVLASVKNTQAASMTKEDMMKYENGGAGLEDAEAAKKRKIEEDKKNANKSLNVKRLEKAGAPKGTPSVASFFAVKKK